jgi:hypothetical protein
MALHQIMDFVANNKHTNIALLTAPPRHDLMQSSCVNSAVTSFNRKLKKLIKAHHDAPLLLIDTNRNLYTKHGLNLNGQGKERLANQIVSNILSVLEHTEGSPIILNYHPVQNEIVHSLEEESDKHNSSPGVLNTVETDCQKYQHHATQEKTRSENTTVGAVHNVNIVEEIDTVTESNRSANRTRKIPCNKIK